MKQMKRILIPALVVVMTACSGTAQPFIGLGGGPVVSVPGGGSSLTLNDSMRSATVTVSEQGYSGTFSATSSSSAVATVAAASSASVRSSAFTIAAAGNGTATITFSDQRGASATVRVDVDLAPAVAVPNALQLTAVGQTQFVDVSERGYSGSFTASSSNSTVATVSPSSGSSGFTVTAVNAGTTTITFTDANSIATTVSVGVTISGLTVNDKLR